MIAPGQTLNPLDNGIVEKYCYDDDESNCETYGGLYDWYELLDYPPDNDWNNGTIQGLCPAGWHIPSSSDWQTLINYLGGEDVAGGKLKTTGTLQFGSGLWEVPNLGATNESGFRAQPGGFVNFEIFGGFAYFRKKGEDGVFWMTGEQDQENVLSISHESTIVGLNKGPFIWAQASVRCVKDP